MFCKEIFGDGSIEMVPPYLLLSEANLGLGMLQSAEGFLSMANWSILKTPKCSNAVRSQVIFQIICNEVASTRGQQITTRSITHHRFWWGGGGIRVEPRNGQHNCKEGLVDDVH